MGLRPAKGEEDVSGADPLVRAGPPGPTLRASSIFSPGRRGLGRLIRTDGSSSTRARTSIRLARQPDFHCRVLSIASYFGNLGEEVEQHSWRNVCGMRLRVTVYRHRPFSRAYCAPPVAREICSPRSGEAISRPASGLSSKRCCSVSQSALDLRFRHWWEPRS
jgi:hypothetical protein